MGFEGSFKQLFFFKLLFRYHNIQAQKRRAKRIYPYLHFESDTKSNTRNLSLITLPSGIETLSMQLMLSA